MTQERHIAREAEDSDRLVVDGNHLSLLPGGPERLAALLRLIEGAGQRLDFYFYIFDRKGSAVEVRDALIAACKRGVAVTLLVDAFGTATTPDSFFAPLIEAGARFGRFGRKRSMRYLIRNHQKMAIADGARVMIGGFNVGDDYFVTEDKPSGWRDMGMIVEGPAVAALQRWFDGLADWTLGEKQSFRALRRMVRKWDPGKGRAVWLMGGPTRHLNGWARCVRRDLQADHKLDMAAAYFSPGWGMVGRLCRAARAGCVRIVVPSRRTTAPRSVRRGISTGGCCSRACSSSNIARRCSTPSCWSSTMSLMWARPISTCAACSSMSS